MRQDSWRGHTTKFVLVTPSPTLPQPAAGLPAPGKIKSDQTPAGRGLVGGGSRPNSLHGRTATKIGHAKNYGLNSARMRLHPSAGGVAGSGAGSVSVSPLGPGSSGACTSGMTAGATAVISRPRGARDSSAVAAAIARRPPRPPAEKGSA